jgi:hypothetical protein
VPPGSYRDNAGKVKPFNSASITCQNWIAQQKGRTIVKPDKLASAQAAVKILLANPAVAGLVRVSAKQVLIRGVWDDQDTKLKIPVQCLTDLIPPKKDLAMGKWLADLKTARNGDPALWSRVVEDNGYDVQAALNLDLYRAATGEDRTDWVFAVQENEPPFHVVSPLPALTCEFLEWGRSKYQFALAYYANCLASNQWPSYAIHGTRYGNMQLIGPEDLRNYSHLVGRGSLVGQG